MTDFKTTTEWQPSLEADMDGVDDVSTGEKGSLKIRVDPYHQLGSFRHADDWKFQAAWPPKPYSSA